MPAPSNTVTIVRWTYMTMLLGMLIGAAMLESASSEMGPAIVDLVGTLLLSIAAVGGASAPAKKMGDAWQAHAPTREAS